MNRILLPLSNELQEAIDGQRGTEARTVWIREAITQRLVREGQPGSTYRLHVPGPDVTRYRSSQHAKRDIKPIPKTGK